MPRPPGDDPDGNRFTRLGQRTPRLPGDGPDSPLMRPLDPEYAPHGRGWSLHNGRSTEEVGSTPRALGDRPYTPSASTTCFEHTPHVRGSPFTPFLAVVIAGPAGAAVDLDRRDWLWPSWHKPR